MHLQSVKSARIRNYSGPHFPAFGLNTERYGISLPIQSEYGKIRTRITLNMYTFYGVLVYIICSLGIFNRVHSFYQEMFIPKHNN